VSHFENKITQRAAEEAQRATETCSPPGSSVSSPWSSATRPEIVSNWDTTEFRLGK
jgi:hypothetical protein